MANEVATQAPERAKPEIVKFGEQLQSKAAQIKMALPEHITPEKFQRTLITAAQSNPTLLEADRQSLVLACMKAAQDALLPDGREAALVIFTENKKLGDGSWQKRKLVQYMPMVYGLRKKILQSGEVVALEVGVVYAAEVDAGKFLYEVGIEPPLRHRPMLELTEEQTSDDQIVAAYSIATMADGSKSYEMMRRFEINKVRQMSQTGAEGQIGKFGAMKGKAIEPKGPWVDWFPEMAKKTVVRRHSKMLPMSGDIIIDVEGREQEAALSATALLASRDADAPQIEDRSGSEERFDGDGVSIDNENGTGSGEPAGDQQRQDPPAGNDKPKRTRRTRAQIEADEAEAEAAAELERRRLAGESDDDAVDEQAGEAGVEGGDAPANNGAVDPAADDSSLDEHPAVSKSKTLIASFESAETIIDLQKRYDASEGDRAAMPDDVLDTVESAFTAKHRALRGNR